MKIFLDMDGVIVDFIKGVSQKFNYTGDWPPGEYDICKVIGCLIWPHLDEEFWVYLDKTPEADSIIRLLQDVAYCILSTPANAASAHGKLKWLQLNYPSLAQRYILTPYKSLLAEGNLLIDDSDTNIRNWQHNGGYGYLVPRPWNSHYARAFNLDELRAVLETLHVKHI